MAAPGKGGKPSGDLAKAIAGRVLAAGVLVGIVTGLLFGLAFSYAVPDNVVNGITIPYATLIFVLVFYHLPQFANYTGRLRKATDWAISLLFGGVMGVLVLLAARTDLAPTVSGYFSENAYPLAKGRNIVNVIIVDFRAADTFGAVVLGGSGSHAQVLAFSRTQAVNRILPGTAFGSSWVVQEVRLVLVGCGEDCPGDAR